VEANSYFLGMNEAQLVSLAIFAVTVPLLVYKASFVRNPARPPQREARQTS
jgi:hypothetical protein